MKKHFYIFLISVCIVMIPACSFLDEEPYSALTDDNVYSSMSALRQNAVLSIYHYIGGESDSQGLQGTGRGVYDLNSITTDEQIMPTRGGDWYDGGYWQSLHLHTWTAGDKSIDDTWNYLFKVVMLATKGIEAIDAYSLADADEQELRALKAELRALRAMYYFYLVDMFGRVPIVTCSDVASESLTLADRGEVYDFAIKELQAAMPLLTHELSNDPLGEYYGRMTYYVARFVQMKLFLNHKVYTGKEDLALYDSVLVCADDLAKKYQLETELATNFSLNNDKSKENIFVIPREVGLFTTRYNYFHRSAHYNHASAMGIGGENGQCATLQTLQVFGYKTAQQDPRFAMYFYDDTVKVNGQIVTAEDGKSPLVYYAEKVALDLSGTEFEKTAGARMKKYEHDPNGQSDATVGKNDIVLFRYADVVLMKAEALVRKGQDATAEINAVRDRVGATQLTSAPTLDDIYKERWLELMWEGWHRNDMIRFGKWTTNGTLSPTDHTTVFPIPGDMMLMHPQWKQNEGYKE